MTDNSKTLSDELREAAARLRGTSDGTTPGPWRRHDTHLNAGGHTATVLAGDRLNDTKLVAWLPSHSDEPWADHPCWANSHWIALTHPGLAEPLASWLEEVARQYDAAPCDDPTGVCNGCERRDDFVTAQSVAQVINGCTS